MTSYVFEPAPRPALPVAGTGKLFPVRRVYCIGRNYAAHAREMGGNPDREPPFFFMKPADALQPVPGDALAVHPYPPETANYHHEAEMVVALGKGGTRHRGGRRARARLRLRRRPRHDPPRPAGRGQGAAPPWEIAKSADLSGPVGPIHPRRGGRPSRRAAGSRLAVDGAVRQDADLVADDLVRAGADRDPVALLSAEGRAT